MLEMMESSRVSDDIILNSLNRPVSSSVTSYYNYMSDIRSSALMNLLRDHLVRLCGTVYVIKQGTLVAWKSRTESWTVSVCMIHRIA